MEEASWLEVVMIGLLFLLAMGLMMTAGWWFPLIEGWVTPWLP